MELLQLAHACGEVHPCLVPLSSLDLIDGLHTRAARECFSYEPSWLGLSEPDHHALRALMLQPPAAGVARA
jgi:hypothetical protein